MTVVLMASATGCRFENNMAYPILKGEFLSFEVVGQKSVEIDSENRIVNITLDENSDISRVLLVDYQLSAQTRIEESLGEVLDLRNPIHVTLKTYQDYEWTISAVQPIERYINVDGQIGEAQFNAAAKVAIVQVASNRNIESIRFTGAKFEPEGSALLRVSGWHMEAGGPVADQYPCIFPITLSCVANRIFTVQYEGREIQWSVKVMKKDVDLEIVSVNAYCYHALVRGTFNGEGDPHVEYRESGKENWTEASDVSISGVGITCDITGLSANTDYEVRIVDGEKISVEKTFHTEKDEQLDNMRFETWWQDGKVWYPFAQNTENPVWDSANKATSSFIGSSTTPELVSVVRGTAARMESKYAVIAFAAGNLYTGHFCNIAGLGAELDWGTPFSSRPVSLKGWYRYEPKPIDKSDDAHKSFLGQMDKCQIQVILTDWDKPFHINTSKGIFVDLAGDSHIIGYGKLESSKATSGYEAFEIKIDYRDKQRVPKYCVLVCASSYMGDYFTGGVGSTLYVDEFEFKYE